MNRTLRLGTGLALVTLLAACGGKAGGSSTAPGPSSDAAPGDENALDAGATQAPTVHDQFVTVLQSPACLPEMLPQDAQGLIPCTVFVLLQSGSDCSPQLGLSDAPPAAAQAVLAKSVGPKDATTCVLAQLPDADRVNGSCTNASEPGWCYVADPVVTQCPQMITFSSAPPAGADVLLGCD